jgi:hypothetical protein
VPLLTSDVVLLRARTARAGERFLTFCAPAEMSAWLACHGCTLLWAILSLNEASVTR